MHLFWLIFVAIASAGTEWAERLDKVQGDCRSDQLVSWASAYHSDCDAAVAVDGVPGIMFDVVSAYWGDGQLNLSVVDDKVVYFGLIGEEKAAAYGIDQGVYVVWGDRMTRTPNGVASHPHVLLKADGTEKRLNFAFFADIDGQLAFEAYGEEGQGRTLVIGERTANNTRKVRHLKMVSLCKDDDIMTRECKRKSVHVSTVFDDEWTETAWVSAKAR